MKAWQAWVEDSDYGYAVVFAETSGRARALAMGTDACEDTDFINIRVRRLPKADILYCGQNEASWQDQEVRYLLVKEYGWRCIDTDHGECENCRARDWCDEYESFLEEQEELLELECREC